MFSKLSLAVLAGCAALLAVPASAQVFTLDFTGVATSSNITTVGGFYNGGTSGDGSSGTNYGVSFTPNALAINVYNGRNEPNPGILFFQSGGAVTINYAAGFTTNFSFFYASNSAATITVYDGLNATGNVLGTVALANNFSSSCSFCQWDAAGVTFAGTARSIDFSGGADAVGYDQITFGSANAGAVPEPAAWGMMITGFGMIGAAARRRSKVKTAISFA